MDMNQVANASLFRGIPRVGIGICLDTLHAYEKKYRKGSIILHAGSKTDYLGLVLSGSVTIESNDVWGNCTVLSHVGPGQVFAETYALLPDSVMLVDVRANENCTIVFLKVGVLVKHELASDWEEKMFQNLLLISAQKNLYNFVTNFNFFRIP